MPMVGKFRLCRLGAVPEKGPDYFTPLWMAF